MDTGEYCTVPYFGFKAKPRISERAACKNCTVPYFGFKAKLETVSMIPRYHCTVPYFGFKAKLFRGCPPWMIIVLCLILDSRQNQYALRYCPQRIVLCLILDSRQNKYASGLMTQGGCPSLATQFQTDFCQSFFNGAGGMKLYVQNMAPVAEVIPSMLR